jgi:lysophospholipase L1-like esterase
MILIGLGLLLFALILYIAYPVWSGIQASKELQADAVAYQQHPDNPRLHFLVAGDSTAVGTGAKDPLDSVAGRLGARYPEADITNVSENGLRLAGLKEKLEALPERRYDLILIQIGANDVVNFTALDDVTSRLRSVLDLAEKQSEMTVVLTSGNIGLSPIFKPPFSNLISWRTRQVRDIFMEEIGARDQVRYVDLYREKGNEPFNTDVPRYYAADLFHPSGEGYGLWFRDIEKVLPEFRRGM